MTLPILAAIAVSFVISWLLTFAMKRNAPRIGFVDKPGGRKIHANPKPLGGGVAIFWAFALPMIAVLIAAQGATFTGTIETVWRALGTSKSINAPSDWQPYAGGVREKTTVTLAILGATLLLHLLGLLDDRKPLGPYP